MRANEFLFESLSSPYHWEPTRNGAAFETADGRDIYVDFEDTFENIYAVAFKTSAPGRSAFMLTGTGDEFRIFATVIDIVQYWVQKNQPDVLTFSANKDEAGRNTLYRRLVRKLAPGLGYVDVSNNVNAIADDLTSNRIHNIKSAYRDYDIFVLARKDMIK